MLNKRSLVDNINEYFSGSYSIVQGNTIPEVGDIALGKNARELDLAMMFIDIRESTKIVDGLRRITAARIYKSFLYGVSQIARLNGGQLRSFNGDGVLIAFIGKSKCTSSVKAAMQMTWFIREILKPKVQNLVINNQSLADLNFSFGIGIDTGKVLIVRGGIRGENNNDLVWVGNATNYAVKLSSLSANGKNIYISKRVYDLMGDNVKFSSEINMWEKRLWTVMNGQAIYRSSWHWAIS